VGKYENVGNNSRKGADFVRCYDVDDCVLVDSGEKVGNTGAGSMKHCG